MTTVTLRQQKLSPLTNQEIDDNFSNLNTNKLESVVYPNLTTSGSGWYRVATTNTDGRGTYDLEVYTTGANHDPSVLKIVAQCNWTGGRVLYAIWDGVFPASSVRVTRSASNSYLEIYFTTSVNTFAVRVNHTGFASGIVGYSGALSSGGDTVAETLALTSRLNVGTAGLTGHLTGTTASFSSYVTMGSLVANDPGSSYYSYTHRLGGSVAVAGNLLVVPATQLMQNLADGFIGFVDPSHSAGWGVSQGIGARTGDVIWALGSNGSTGDSDTLYLGIGSISNSTFSTALSFTQNKVATVHNKLRIFGTGVANPTTADNTDNSILSLRASNALVRLQFGTRNTGNYAAWIQASYDNGGGANGLEPLELNPLGGTVFANGYTVLNANNYTSYSPTLTGGGASGTWSINISGNSATVTSITSSQVTSALGYTPYNSSNPSGYITGYTETDTLATVTARGASTSTAVTLSADSNRIGNLYVGYGTYKNSITPVGDSNMNLDTPSGAVYVTTSIRAPILYDSNNTAFYVDPASTTNLNTTYLQGGKFYTLSNNSGNSIDIYMRPHGDDTYVWRHIYGGSGTGYGTGVGGYGIYNHTLGGDYSLLFNAAGYVTAPYSLRSPIFYDSNDTSYYVDPASTTAAVLKNIIIKTQSQSWSEGIRIDVPSQTSWAGIRLTYNGESVHAGNWAFGNTNEANYDITLYSGSDSTSKWRLDHSGNNTAVGSMRSPVFYDSNDTGYYTDPNSTTRFNNLQVAGAIQGSSTSYSAYNSSTTLLATPSGVNITAAYLHFTGANSIAPYTMYRTGGDWPVPYGIGFSTGGESSGIFQQYASNNSSLGPMIFYTGNDGSGSFSWRRHTWESTSYVGSGSNNIGTALMDLDWGQNLYVYGSSRAPIFYDNNDTSYYLDPSSGDTALNIAGNIVQGNGGSNTGLAIYHGGGSNDYARIRFYQAGSNNQTIHIFPTTWQGGTFASTSTGSINLYGTNGVTFGTWNDLAAYIGNSGNFWTRLSIQAPVGTFTNDGSSRVLYLKGSGNIIQFQDADGTNRWENVGRNGTYYVYKGYGTGSGYKWQIDDSGNQGFNGIVTFNTDARAPIFYDTDTSYYVDPNGNSRVNQLGVGGNNTSYTFYNHGTSYFNGAINIYNTATFTAGNQLQFYTSGGSLRGYINATDNDDNHLQIATSGGEDIVFKDGGLSGTRNLVIRGGNAGTEAYGSMRSPIFYDSSDSSYYLDPNSTSRLYRVDAKNLAGAILNIVTSNIGIATGYNEATTWIDGSTIQAHVSTAQSHGGCYMWYHSESVEVDPEKDYEFSYWVKSNGQNNVYFGWHEIDASGNYLSSNPYFTGSTVNTNGTWQKRVALLRSWRTPSPNSDSSGTDRFATTTSRNTTGLDGVMHSNTRKVLLRFGTCYGDGSQPHKTYFYLASIREVTGHDRQQQTLTFPYYNGSSYSGSFNIRTHTHWDSISGIDLIGASGEFRMSSDSGSLNLRVDGGVIAHDTSYFPLINDLADSAYYLDPNGTSRLYNVFVANQLRSPNFYDTGANFIFQPGTTSGTTRHLNLANTTGDPAGVSNGDAVGITWGQRTDSNPYYLIYPYYYANGYSSHTRLRLAWHTGIEIGAASGYGGTRFFDNSPFTGSEIFSVGKGDSHVRVNNNLYISGVLYDSNDNSYYVDPNGTNRLNFVNSNNHYIQPGYMLYSDHGSWQGEYNKIQWHSSHLYLQNNGGGNLLILRRGDGGERFYCDYNGNVTASGNITAYSDQRLKTNIETIANPLELVNKLRGVTFDWIETGKHSYGLIAQEVEQVIPELVLETTNGNTETDVSTTVKSVDYSKLVSVLIEAVKEQQQQIDKLTKLVEVLLAK